MDLLPPSPQEHLAHLIVCVGLGVAEPEEPVAEVEAGGEGGKIGGGCACACAAGGSAGSSGSGAGRERVTAQGDEGAHGQDEGGIVHGEVEGEVGVKGRVEDGGRDAAGPPLLCIFLLGCW